MVCVTTIGVCIFWCVDFGWCTFFIAKIYQLKKRILWIFTKKLKMVKLFL